jgi:hypothetical protein
MMFNNDSCGLLCLDSRLKTIELWETPQRGSVPPMPLSKGIPTKFLCALHPPPLFVCLSFICLSLLYLFVSPLFFFSINVIEIISITIRMFPPLYASGNASFVLLMNASLEANERFFPPTNKGQREWMVYSL